MGATKKMCVRKIKRENGAKGALRSSSYKASLLVGFFVLIGFAKFYILVTDFEKSINYN